MDSLILRDVRCFHSTVEAPLAPLTLLVGENSTGKSTFLAAIRSAWDIAKGHRQPDFNEEPFQLGAYDQIANVRVGRGVGRADSFLIGFGFSARQKASSGVDCPGRLEATFKQIGAQPVVEEWRIDSAPYSISMTHLSGNGEKTGPTKLNIKAPSGKYVVPLPKMFEGVGFDLDILDYVLRHALKAPQQLLVDEEGSKLNVAVPDGDELDSIGSILSSVRNHVGTRPYAMAPIRTEPQRTYHPTRETRRAAGAHIPMILAEMSGGDAEAWRTLRERLDQFGTESGLFKHLNVKRLGKKLSDPFQLEIKVMGRAFSLVDVGYGVSQVLPILVDSILREHKLFLMQQPEVHLHPRAQAELGTMLGFLVKKEKKQFVVETHSDYIIDRIRLDIRDKKSISANDVVILYFERTGQDVVIHPIRIDEHGNVVGAPPTYRDFFLAEERRFFGA